MLRWNKSSGSIRYLLWGHKKYHFQIGAKPLKDQDTFAYMQLLVADQTLQVRMEATI